MAADFTSAVRRYNTDNDHPTVATTATAVDASNPWQGATEQPVAATHQPPGADSYGYAEPEPEPDVNAPLDGGAQESDHLIGVEPGRWDGYLKRVCRIFSPCLGVAIFLGLVTRDVPFFANLTLAIALFYPVLIAVYLHYARSDELTKPMVVAIMVIAVSPFGLIFGSDLMAIFLTTASYFICCLDSKRTLRRLQDIHGSWAGFCFGIIAMGLK